MFGLDSRIQMFSRGLHSAPAVAETRLHVPARARSSSSLSSLAEFVVANGKMRTLGANLLNSRWLGSGDVFQHFRALSVLNLSKCWFRDIRTTQCAKFENYALYDANALFSEFGALFVANGSRLGVLLSFSADPLTENISDKIPPKCQSPETGLAHRAAPRADALDGACLAARQRDI